MTVGRLSCCNYSGTGIGGRNREFLVDRVMIKLINFSSTVIARLLREIGNETDRRKQKRGGELKM